MTEISGTYCTNDIIVRSSDDVRYEEKFENLGNCDRDPMNSFHLHRFASASLSAGHIKKPVCKNINKCVVWLNLMPTSTVQFFCMQVVQVHHYFPAKRQVKTCSRKRFSTRRGWVQIPIHSRDLLFDGLHEGDLLMFNLSQGTRGVKRSLLIRSVNKKTCMQKTCTVDKVLKQLTHLSPQTDRFFVKCFKLLCFSTNNTYYPLQQLFENSQSLTRKATDGLHGINYRIDSRGNWC